ncbi:MAG: alanine racemase [candidate division Zixibacteria bacterium]|nr:alanine racemase [candidate division Zixibacteria bacterium]
MKDGLPLKVSDIDTPALLIERRILEINIRRMQQLADDNRIILRPHIKAHKMPYLALKQIAAGAGGIAAAKLSEAEIMIKNGLDDIQIANQVVGPTKIERLFRLSQKAKISCAVDSPVNAREISAFFAKHGQKIDVLIEIDTGLKRCGLNSPKEIIKLARQLIKLKGINFRGLMTHAGHAYAASGKREVAEIGGFEGRFMVETAGLLRAAGIPVNEVSVGSTPTAPHAALIPGITEIRPGNYIFNDMMQVALGVVTVKSCALTILATVISRPDKNRVVIDAGSKALALDKGAHGLEQLKGYGHILKKKATLERLSEEHGIIKYDREEFLLGEKVRLIPNHACPVVNLFDFAYLVDGQKVLELIPIEARGMMT